MGLRDTADQLDACRAQSVRDEARIAELENRLDERRAMTDDLRTQLDLRRSRIADLEATVEGLARQNAELEHDLARAESALADRLQHDAHTRPTTHTLDRDTVVDLLTDEIRNMADLSDGIDNVADRIVALVQPTDGILITPEEAQLAIRAARHSAESIRSVLAVDPARLHPDVAPYAERLDDLADRLTR